MQTVSTAWNENQAQRVIRAPTTLEISILVTDPAAMAAASSSANGEEAYSDAASLVSREEKSPVRYATLEHNLFLLDGSFELLPSGAPYGSNGYIGTALSGAGTVFTVPPVVTIDFGEVFLTTLEGLTISWGTAYDGEYAEKFSVTAYNGSTVVASKTVEGNTEQTVQVFLAMTGYDRIEIEVLRWSLPYRRARITSVIVGIEHIYRKRDVSEYTHKMSARLLPDELPTAEVSFQVDNSDLLFDPDNGEGMSKYLMERQEVTVRYGYELPSGTETIPAAVAFLDEWETPRSGLFAQFTARGVTALMEEKYTGSASGTLYDIAQAAFTQAELPTLSDGTERWSIDSSLQAISAPSGADLSENTLAEVVQLAAFAACCVLYQDRAGVLHIEPFTAGAEGVYAITRGNEFGYPETELSKPLRSVNINDGAYILSVTSSGVEQSVSNRLISTERAPVVAAWVRDILLNRQTLTGEWRADPKVDQLDTVTVDTPFSTNRTVLTSVELTFNGAWRGNYEGRVMP